MLAVQLHKRRADFTLDLNFSVDGPGVIALFGQSGCGKSTTVNLIAGLLKPDHGQIKLDDEVLFDSTAGINAPAESRRIGYVFQDARLFPHYRVQQNLLYGLRRAPNGSHRIEFDAVVELLSIEHLLQRRPHQLSGGEKQRVAIGRALLAQPRLLLLDEPLASLDQARREEVLPYLERLRDFLNIPMVYVSHQFEEVLRLATHVVLMNHGKCAAQGDLPSISLNPQLRALIGAEAIGAVIDGRVNSLDENAGLAQVGVGNGALHVDSQGLTVGQAVRLQLLARDLILALDPPKHLSVRNTLHATITRITPDERHAALVELDAGGVMLIARITTPAAAELQLRPGLAVWILVKAVTLRGHVFAGPANNAQQAAVI